MRVVNDQLPVRLSLEGAVASRPATATRGHGVVAAVGGAAGGAGGSTGAAADGAAGGGGGAGCTTRASGAGVAADGVATL